MKIEVLSAGKIREKWLQGGIAEYLKRLSRYGRVYVTEVEDGPGPKEEAERMLKLISGGARVIALSIDGERLSSIELAERIEREAVSGNSHLIFMIGGPWGMDESLLERADWRLSFSAMTFPHPLMRLILLEQIYRAFRIMKGEPYHK